MKKLRILSFVQGCSIFLLAVPLLAQDAKLIEAAKKEGGKVVVYGSIENDTMDLIGAAFKKKTGLEVEFWRAASTKVMDRVLGETRTETASRCRPDHHAADGVHANEADYRSMIHIRQILSGRKSCTQPRPAVSQRVIGIPYHPVLSKRRMHQNH
jgi:hypothetical protein